jgi:hypothetical protein
MVRSRRCRAATSAERSMPSGGDPSITPAKPRPRSVTATTSMTPSVLLVLAAWRLRGVLSG